VAEIKDVRTEAGARVTLRFDAEGYSTQRLPGAGSRWLAIVVAGPMVISAVGLALAAALDLPEEYMIAAALPGALGLLAAAAIGLVLYIGELIGLALFVATLPVALPLAVVSTRARRFFFGGRPGSRARHVALANIEQGWVSPDKGETVVIVRLLDGSVLRYRAADATGRDLAGAMSRLLGPRLATRS
jgi:hypothetical protein